MLIQGDKIKVIYHTVTREADIEKITLETVFAIYKIDGL